MVPPRVANHGKLKGSYQHFPCITLSTALSQLPIKLRHQASRKTAFRTINHIYTSHQQAQRIQPLTSLCHLDRNTTLKTLRNSPHFPCIKLSTVLSQLPTKLRHPGGYRTAFCTINHKYTSHQQAQCIQLLSSLCHAKNNQDNYQPINGTLGRAGGLPVHPTATANGNLIASIPTRDWRKNLASSPYL